MTDQLHTGDADAAVHPSGWYPDAEASGGGRYWDGAAWSHHRQAIPTPPSRRRRLPAWGSVAIIMGALIGGGGGVPGVVADAWKAAETDGVMVSVDGAWVVSGDLETVLDSAPLG